jgi:hypothetical protein
MKYAKKRSEEDGEKNDQSKAGGVTMKDNNT